MDLILGVILLYVLLMVIISPLVVVATLGMFLIHICAEKWDASLFISIPLFFISLGVICYYYLIFIKWLSPLKQLPFLHG